MNRGQPYNLKLESYSSESILDSNDSNAVDKIKNHEVYIDWSTVETNMVEIMIPVALGIVLIMLLLAFCITCIGLKYRCEFVSKGRYYFLRGHSKTMLTEFVPILTNLSCKTCVAMGKSYLLAWHTACEQKVIQH